MTYDLIIRRGLIVDGTGAEPSLGDVAIDGDTIQISFEVVGTFALTMNAEGLGSDGAHARDHALASWICDCAIQEGSMARAVPSLQA